ncbi:MAG: hypothetical protein LBF54_03875 [Holosporaceae bacterium]|jgi:hypothetical protein|nr:hypothetical protein [Holosporaceae bacterium]
MSENTHSKRTSFWKNLIAAAMTLSLFGNSEARVTREVAEATIPYLLRAVGIQSATVFLQNAVRDMLYTDEGQKQMVEWAKKGVFPPLLSGGGFAKTDLYLHGWLKLELQHAAGT